MSKNVNRVPSKNYVLRSYNIGDEEEIVELIKLVFDGWPHFDLSCSPLEHWRWKYKDNPFKTIFITLGICDERIVGCYHSIPLRLKIGDIVIQAYLSADLAVHPDFRGIGIAKKMREQRTELLIKRGIRFDMGITLNPIWIKSMSKIRHGFPHALIKLVRVRDINLHLHVKQSKYVWLKKYLFWLVNQFHKLRNALRVSASSAQNFRILEISSFDESINVFWDEVKVHYNFIVERDQDYLNWRYCDPRGGNYVVKIAREGERILGYIVIRINRYNKDYPEGYIVDLITLPDCVDVADAMVANAVNYFDSNNINAIYCLCVKNHVYENLFKRHGFINGRSGHYAHYQHYETIGEDLSKFQTSIASKIHYVYGVSDWI